MTVKELYNYKLDRYKKFGIRDELDRLLLLLLLDEKDNYDVFTCSRGDFYNQYKDEINRKIAKIESDFDVTKELLEEIIEDKGVLTEDFEYDRVWYVYDSGFGGLQWGIIYQNDKSKEELYALNFDDDEDIRLLDCLNDKFNYLDFITLFVANLKLRNEEMLRYVDLKEILIKYYNDEKYKCLFGNLKLVKDDKETLDIDMMIKLAEIRNLVSVYDNVEDYLKLITISEEDSWKQIYNYKGKYQFLMNDLTVDYLNNLYNNDMKKEKIRLLR